MKLSTLLKEILDPFRVFTALILAVGLWLASSTLFHAGVPQALASPPNQDGCHRECIQWEPGFNCRDGHSCKDHCVAFEDVCDGGGAASPPTVSGSISCTPGNNGWCVGNTQLVISASDPQGYALTISGGMGGTPIYCPGSYCAWSLPPAYGGSAWYTASASSGLTASGGTNWWYDPIPPISKINLSGTGGANGWYVSQVNASAGGSDSISGLAAATLSVDGGAAAGSVVIRDGVHSVTVTARDVAGNTASKTQTVTVDTHAPEIFVFTAGSQASDGWFSTAVELSATASDETSGVDDGVALSFDNGGTWEAGPRTLSDGLYDVSFRVSDHAGNVAASELSLKIDTQPPTITLTEAGDAGRNGWYLSDTMLSVKVEDNLSGIASVQHRINDGAWQEGNSITVQEGVDTIDFRAFDAAGNEQGASREIHVDTSPPAYAFDAGLAGSVLADIVHLTGTVSDQTSTVQSAEFSSDGTTWQPVSFENGTWTLDWDSSAFDNGERILYLRAKDVAGNQGEPIRASVILDNIPPYVNLSETWNIWEGGELTVFNNVIPLESIRIVVHDPRLRYPDQVIHDKLPAPKTVTWDRVIGPASAPPGTYTITVEVCDIHGLCTKDTGTVVIPDVPTPTSILPPEEPVRRWWQLPLTLPRPAEPEPIPSVVIPPVEVPAQEPAAPVSYPLWTTFLLGLLLLLFTFLLLFDPRPSAYRSLTRCLAESLNR